MLKMRNNYSFVDKCQLVWWLIRSKLIDRRVRLLRFPITIRGKKSVNWGEKLTTGVGCRFDCFSLQNSSAKRLVFGKNVQLNDYVHIVAMDHIEIGDNVLMASHVFISDNSHGFYKGGNNDSDPAIPPIEREYSTAPVRIGNNVWIGEGVAIMPGVEIGEGCVIGAHSIVNKSIPPNTIAVGAPAVPVKRWNPETNKWMKI